MAADNTTNKIQFDISELKAGIQESNRLIKLANSEFKAAASGMDNWSDSTEGLAAKIKQLSTVEEQEQRKLEILKKQYAQVAEEQGENSKGAVELATKINNQQAAVNRVSSELKTYESRLDTVKSAQEKAEETGRDFEEVLKEIDKAAEGAAESAEGADGGFSVFKGALADLVSSGIQAALSGLKDLAGALMELPEATKEYRTVFGAVKQSAADSVIGVDGAKKAFEEFYKVAADEGQAAEATSHLANLVSSEKELQDAIDGVTGAWVEHGDSISIEGLAEAANETASTGKITGQLADALTWAGESEEEFQKKLDECSTEQERQQLVVKKLNDLYGDNAEKYRESNASLLDTNAANLKLLESQSEMAETVEPLTALWTSLKANAIEAITPAIAWLSEKIQDLTKWLDENEEAATVIKGVILGVATALGVLATALLISNLITAVQKAFALLNLTMLANPVVLIVAAIAGLVVAFVTLWKKSDAFREFWIKLWDKVRTTAAKAADKFREIVDKIVSFFKELPGKIWNAITGAISKVTTWGVEMRAEAIKAAANLITGLIDKLMELPGKIKSIGGDVAKGLWNGINDKVSWLKGKIQDFVGNVKDWLKKFFKIGSPSKLMRDEIGQFLPMGIAEGIQDTAKIAIEGMRQLKEDIMGAAAFDTINVPQIDVGYNAGLQAAGAQAAGGTVVNNTYTFNQTNNSPRALERIDIYRQTKQQLKQLKRL